MVKKHNAVHFSRKKVNKKYLYFFFVFLALLAGWGITKKIDYLSADPKGEKDCPPLIPDDALNTDGAGSQTAQLPRIIPFVQNGGVINDASCLNKTSVYGIVKPKTEEDVKNAILYAHENGLKISVAGIKHSMGGQAFAKNALILDMTRFDHMSLNKEKKVLTVQSGATWQKVQNFLHPQNLAVKSMQSIDIFTVGGTVSVNAHGMDHVAGSIASTIRSLRLMDSKGNIRTLSRTDDPKLFQAVIGGYGLFGIILDVDLDITENVMYKAEQQLVNYRDFPDIFKKTIDGDKNIGLFYTNFSVAPQSFLKDLMLYSYITDDDYSGAIPPLEEKGGVKLRRFILNFAKTGPVGKEIKWLAESYLAPLIDGCNISRNEAMRQSERCLVSRNEIMGDSVPYIKNNIPTNTDILQEYFIPRNKFIPFIDGMRDILQKNHVNVLATGIRIVNKEDNMLNYAPENMFALVLYLNQNIGPEHNEKMEKATSELIDFTTQLGGTFYLPYQLYYTKEQLHTAYPNIDEFFAYKKEVDPNELFVNKFYLKYKNI